MKPDSTDVKQWTTKQVIFATLFVVSVFLSFWLLYRFRAVVFLLFIAMVIGTTIRPAVEWLHRRGLSRPAGIIAIYLIIAAVLVGFIALVVPLVVDQITQLSQFLPQLQMDFRTALITSDNLLLRNIGWRIPVGFNFFGNSNPSNEEVFNQVSQTFLFANTVLKGILSVLVVFLLAYYWTQESNFIIRGTLRLIPRSRRREIRDFIQAVELKIAGYVRGQGILSLVVGVAAFISYALIGLPYTLVLAIIAGLMEMVPIFGPALGAIPALLVALAFDPSKAIWVVVATVLIQLAENVWLVPRIMTSSMGVNPIIILLSLVTFSAVFGFPGALLALPLAAIIQMTLERLLLSARGEDPSVQPNELNLQTLVGRSKATVRAIAQPSNGDKSFFAQTPEHIQSEISSIAQDISELLQKLKREEES